MARRWHAPPTALDLVSITGMEEAASAEQRLVTLRAALLAYYDEHTSPSGVSRF